MIANKVYQWANSNIIRQDFAENFRIEEHKRYNAIKENKLEENRIANKKLQDDDAILIAEFIENMSEEISDTISLQQDLMSDTSKNSEKFNDDFSVGYIYGVATEWISDDLSKSPRKVLLREHKSKIIKAVLFYLLDDCYDHRLLSKALTAEPSDFANGIITGKSNYLLWKNRKSKVMTGWLMHASTVEERVEIERGLGAALDVDSYHLFSPKDKGSLIELIKKNVSIMEQKYDNCTELYKDHSALSEDELLVVTYACSSVFYLFVDEHYYEFDNNNEDLEDYDIVWGVFCLLITDYLSGIICDEVGKCNKVFNAVLEERSESVIIMESDEEKFKKGNIITSLYKNLKEHSEYIVLSLLQDFTYFTEEECGDLHSEKIRNRIVWLAYSVLDKSPKKYVQFL